MRRALRRLIVLLFLLAVPFMAFGSPPVLERVDASAAAQAFPLVVQGRAARIVLPEKPAEVILRAAAAFAQDVQLVTDVRPDVVEAIITRGVGPVVVLQLDPALAGRWEAFRLAATGDQLIVSGSDPRGLAYGLFELSSRIGVSPWVWWADVPPVRSKDLFLRVGETPIDQPAVRYRGVFLNDEGWGLEPWASTTHEPEVGNLGPKTYGRLFELLLRLRANSIWPAMHPGTVPFHQVPGNAAIADAYAIVVGSSHAEPMLRNNVGEWKQDKALYNFLTNRDGVLAYWEERVRERTNGESLFTLGMRGIHDSAIVGPKNQAERIAALESIFAAQRDLLARHLGGGDPTRVAQIFCPYKEVLEDYLAGLRVPEDVTLVWPDDNFGYIRRFASPSERERTGGLGVYYHLSYLGAPFAWLWLDTIPPALVWSEMMRAYEQGARTFWIANVGDLKLVERSTEFFLDLAWHADRTDTAAPGRFLRAMAARDFGAQHAEAIARIWEKHLQLAVARKPEHLQWNIPFSPYKPTELTEREIRQRLEAYAQLDREVLALAAAIEPEWRDAYFQLVEYQVRSAAAANERYFLAELARLLRARGDASAGDTFGATDLSEQRIKQLTLRYNERIAGGKWRNIVQTNGLSPREWRRFQPDPGLIALTSPAQEAVRAPAPEPEPIPLVVPPDARPGDFVEHGGVVSIIAGNPTSKNAQGDGAAWQEIPGLGRSGQAVTVLPSTATIDPLRPPELSYRFFVRTGGAASVHVRLLPTFPLGPETGLRFALALDDASRIDLALTDGFNPSSDAWKQRVLTNAATVSVALPQPLEPGWHTLRLLAVDAGVVVDKIVIDLGGLRPSYDGPPETCVE